MASIGCHYSQSAPQVLLYLRIAEGLNSRVVIIMVVPKRSKSEMVGNSSVLPAKIQLAVFVKLTMAN